MDVVTIGESMVLLSSEDILPLEYVPNFKKQVAGAESNVAIGLAKLGHAVSWISKLGEDPFGRFIRNSIRAEGVNTSYCVFTKDAQTGIFFKEKKAEAHVNVYYYRKNSAASHLEPKDIDESSIAQAKILYLSGITAAISDSAYETILHAIRLAKKHQIQIAFDPNLRLKLMDLPELKERMMHIMQFVDLVLIGDSEGKLLTDESKADQIANQLIKYGPQTIVVKCGAKGAYYHSAKETGFVDAFPIEKVVDPVGAGDGFTAGFLHGILSGKSLQTAVRMGNAVGAFVVQVNGDIEGLPTIAELEQKINDSNEEKEDVNR